MAAADNWETNDMGKLESGLRSISLLISALDNSSRIFPLPGYLLSAKIVEYQPKDTGWNYGRTTNILKVREEGYTDAGREGLEYSIDLEEATWPSEIGEYVSFRTMKKPNKGEFIDSFFTRLTLREKNVRR